MNVKKILALMLCAMMLLSLAACGAKGNDKQADMSGDSSAMTGEPKNAKEALALHKELLERENAILSENTELWEKVFMAADKGMTMQEDGKNYGDFLLDTVEAAKEQFTDKEYAWLKESATEISNIENRLTELEEKYPEIIQKSMDGDMSMPAGSDTSTPPTTAVCRSSPPLKGKIWTQHGEERRAVLRQRRHRGEFLVHHLQSLRRRAFRAGCAEQGTGGERRLPHRRQHLHAGRDEKAIAEAKDVLAKKGATYQNVYFNSDGEAGKFTTNIFAYPTTYVVDRSGNIVGEPIVGAITEKKQAETLQKLIDQALAADMG